MAGYQRKPDVPTLVSKVCRLARLPAEEGKRQRSLNRGQLVQLCVYLEELNRANGELKGQLQSISRGLPT